MSTSAPRLRVQSGQGFLSNHLGRPPSTSSGCPGLDHIVGGGIPVGTMLVFQDQPFPYHASTFLQVFAAEGLRIGQRVAIAAPCDGRSLFEFTRKIPTSMNFAEFKTIDDHNDFRGDGDSSLKIAWRYENVPKVNSVLGKSVSVSSSISNAAPDREFDLGKLLDDSEISSLIQFTSSLGPASTIKTVPLHEELLEWVYKECKQTSSSNVTRVCLPEIDSPLWGFADSCQFSRFVFQLRSLVRFTNSIICLSVSSDLHETFELNKIRRLSDAYFLLESLDESSKTPMFKEFQAVFRVQKSFSVNALKPSLLDDHEFGFRIGRRRIVLERLHLPPAIPQQSSDSVRINSGSCNVVNIHGLDF